MEAEIVPDGNSSKVASLLQAKTEGETLVLPLGLPSDAIYTTNEHIDRFVLMSPLSDRRYFVGSLKVTFF